MCYLYQNKLWNWLSNLAADLWRNSSVFSLFSPFWSTPKRSCCLNLLLVAEIKILMFQSTLLKRFQMPILLALSRKRLRWQMRKFSIQWIVNSVLIGRQETAGGLANSAFLALTQYTSHYCFYCFLISSCNEVLLWRILCLVQQVRALFLLVHCSLRQLLYILL